MRQPSKDGYVGVSVKKRIQEAAERPAGVRYQGEMVPSQEAPPRPGMLRSFNGSSSNGLAPRPGPNGLGRRWEAWSAPQKLSQS